MTSILQFSDIHFGVEDREAMAAIAAMAEQLKPDVCVICGDITQNGKVREFKAAQIWIRSLPGVKLITPGNHDTPMFGLLHRIFSPFGRYNRYIAPLGEPAYTDRNVSIVPINTARGWQMKLDWSLGVIDVKVLQDKIKILNAARPGTLKMLACHHPLVYPPSSPLQKTTQNGAKASQLLSDHNIDAVLSGHVHAPFYIMREPGRSALLEIGSGTLSTRRRGVRAGFNHIRILDDSVQVSAINWTGSAYEIAKPISKPRQRFSPLAS